jgi:uncharacterized protein DUF4157
MGNATFEDRKKKPPAAPPAGAAPKAPAPGKDAGQQSQAGSHNIANVGIVSGQKSGETAEIIEVKEPWDKPYLVFYDSSIKGDRRLQLEKGTKVEIIGPKKQWREVRVLTGPHEKQTGVIQDKFLAPSSPGQKSATAPKTPKPATPAPAAKPAGKGKDMWSVDEAFAEPADPAVERQLTDEEEREARIVFGRGIDWSKVRVGESAAMSVGGYARTPGTTVYFPPGFLSRSLEKRMPLMIHELTHVWQSQHGYDVLDKLYWALHGSGAYDYGGEDALRKASLEGKRFKEFNTEQQGDICEDYYKKKKAGQDVSAYQPFIDQIQGGAAKGDFEIPAGKDVPT